MNATYLGKFRDSVSDTLFGGRGKCGRTVTLTHLDHRLVFGSDPERWRWHDLILGWHSSCLTGLPLHHKSGSIGNRLAVAQTAETLPVHRDGLQGLTEIIFNCLAARILIGNPGARRNLPLQA